jgi:hypothetical protein
MLNGVELFLSYSTLQKESFLSYGDPYNVEWEDEIMRKESVVAYF